MKEIRNINTVVVWENDYNNVIEPFNFEQFIIEKLNIELQ